MQASRWMRSRRCFDPRSARGATSASSSRTRSSALRSTLPHGERRRSRFRRPAQACFDLPHGERRRHPGHGRRGVAVSIHAPARGATDKLTLHPHREKVSIPRSRTGTTGAPCPGRDAMQCFDPRSRTGSDKDTSRHEGDRSMFRSTLPHREQYVLTWRLEMERNGHLSPAAKSIIEALHCCKIGRYPAAALTAVDEAVERAVGEIAIGDLAVKRLPEIHAPLSRP